MQGQGSALNQQMVAPHQEEFIMPPPQPHPHPQHQENNGANS